MAHSEPKIKYFYLSKRSQQTHQPSRLTTQTLICTSSLNRPRCTITTQNIIQTRIRNGENSRTTDIRGIQKQTTTRNNRLSQRSTF